MVRLNSYESCMQQLRRELGLAEDARGLELHGESFYIAPSSAASNDHATVYVLVADELEKVSADTLKQLLWQQLQSVGPSTPVFGWDADEGHLLIAQTISLDDMRVTELTTLMALLATLAARARFVVESDISSNKVPNGAKAAGKSPSVHRLPRGWLPLTVSS